MATATCFRGAEDLHSHHGSETTVQGETRQDAGYTDGSAWGYELPSATAWNLVQVASIGRLPIAQTLLPELAQPLPTTTARHRTPSRMAPDPAMLQRQSFLSRVSQRVSQELVEPPQQVCSRGICSLPLLAARPAAATAAAAATCYALASLE